MAAPETLDALFREAVIAIDAGDVAALERMLIAHPRLACERLKSPGAWLRDKVGDGAINEQGFFHAPFLLWFVCEDPVRNPSMPASVAEVARTIIQAAKRGGVSTLEEQLDYALHLAVCSPIGREDGRQIQLLDALIDGGASFERQPQDVGGIVGQALICNNHVAAEHLAKRGADLSLATAACLERWHDMARLAGGASARDQQIALALCALNGKARALSKLLDLGVDISAYSAGFYTHATALHHAVCSGSLEAVQVLAEAGAALDIKDRAWNGTPLDWAEHYVGEHTGQCGHEEHLKRYEEIAAYLRAKQL